MKITILGWDLGLILHFFLRIVTNTIRIILWTPKSITVNSRIVVDTMIQ